MLLDSIWESFMKNRRTNTVDFFKSNIYRFVVILWTNLVLLLVIQKFSPLRDGLYKMKAIPIYAFKIQFAHINFNRARGN